MHLLTRSTVFIGSMLLSVGAILAKDNYLPDRDTPVPANQQIPIIDFVRPTLFESPVLNPAGTHFAAITKNSELGDSVLICEIATGKVSWSHGGVYSFAWISNQHLMIYTRSPLRRAITEKGMGIEAVGGPGVVIDINKLSKRLDYKSVLPERKRGLMPDTGFLWGWPSSDIPYGVLYDYWILPETGDIGYCVVMLQSDSKLHLYRLENKKWVDCPVDLDEITLIAIGNQPGEMLVLGPRIKGQPRAVQKLDTITGTLGEIVYQDARYDCGPDIFHKRGTWELQAVSLPNSPRRLIWLDAKHQQVQSMIDRQFPGTRAEIVSTDLKESRFIVSVESDKHPPIFYYLDLDKKSLGLLKKSAPWIDPARMRPMQLMAYKARDGTPIDAYLTLPEGATKEHPVPLVVGVHAGPWYQADSWEWDAYAQFLASRGYAVLQPNYRGSKGYDSRFEKQDRFDFQKMSNDVTDGVRILIKSGLVDANRVAIGGVGFGGYLAFSGVVDEPGLYRCAYTLGGVFDWEKLFNKKDSSTLYENRWLQNHFSELNLSPPAPLARSGEIKIPVFITKNLHVRDTTYDSQVRDLFVALKGKVPCVNFGDLNLYEENEACGIL